MPNQKRILNAATLLPIVASLCSGQGTAPSTALPSIAAGYTFQTVDVPFTAATEPLGINSKREIIGYYIDLFFQLHGFLYRGGNFTTIDHPKAKLGLFAGTVTGGINDRGDVVGTYTDSNGFDHGFLLSRPDWCGDEDEGACKAAFHDIDVPGAAQTKGIDFELGPGLGTAAIGINNRRQIVGMYATPGLYSNGFILSNGDYKHVDHPMAAHLPGDGSKLFTINNFGRAAGDYLSPLGSVSTCPGLGPNPQMTSGFVLDGSTYTPIFVKGSEKGGFGTQVSGINDLGLVVGIYSDPSCKAHGLVWGYGLYFQLDYPNQPYSELHSISNRGDITGAYSTSASPGPFTIHGFVAYPKGN